MNPRPYFFVLILALGVAAALGLTFDLAVGLGLAFVFAGFLAMEAVQNYIFEVGDDLGAKFRQTFLHVILPLAAPGIFAGSVFIFVNGIGVALVPTILGGPGAVNAGLIVNQAIVALDFPLAMATSTIIILTLLLLLYIGHRLFDLTKVLEPIN